MSAIDPVPKMPRAGFRWVTDRYAASRFLRLLRAPGSGTRPDPRPNATESRALCDYDIGPVEVAERTRECSCTAWEAMPRRRSTTRSSLTLASQATARRRCKLQIVGLSRPGLAPAPQANNPHLAGTEGPAARAFVAAARTGPRAPLTAETLSSPWP